MFSKNTVTDGFGRKKSKTVFEKPKKTEIVFIPSRIGARLRGNAPAQGELPTAIMAKRPWEGPACSRKGARQEPDARPRLAVGRGNDDRCRHAGGSTAEPRRCNGLGQGRPWRAPRRAWEREG
jgi:hypothetical protein